MKLINQIQINSLSVISLIVALTALGYNTYRNELTEQNRNTRLAGFELLMELNELQLLADFAHYGDDRKSANPIKGWSHILYINDMSHLISNQVLTQAELLQKTWSDEWETLQTNETSNKNITLAIRKLRTMVMDTIKRLD
jgi:hypothetical protein